tara:strand:- start:446 stop:694 length:249 start_codon:yes stop_codon:yes gene_type:complete
MTADELSSNQPAYISTLPTDIQLAIQLLEQGFAVGTEIELAHRAPFNGAIAFRLHNTKISMSQSIARQITVIKKPPFGGLNL